MRHLLVLACVIALFFLIVVMVAQAMHVACGEIVGDQIKICSVRPA